MLRMWNDKSFRQWDEQDFMQWWCIEMRRCYHDAMINVERMRWCEYIVLGSHVCFLRVIFNALGDHFWRFGEPFWWFWGTIFDHGGVLEGFLNKIRYRIAITLTLSLHFWPKSDPPEPQWAPQSLPKRFQNRKKREQKHGLKNIANFYSF